jgi:hypothetical protein
MRYDAPILVKRLAPMVGRPTSPRRQAVAYQALSLADAERYLRELRQHDAYWRQQALGPTSYARDEVTWRDRRALWIEKRGQPATVKR